MADTVSHQAYLLEPSAMWRVSCVCRPPEEEPLPREPAFEEELVRSIAAMTWLQVAIAICFLFGLG